MKSISKSPNYIFRNHYSYYFRIRVPQDLQPYLGRKELRYSLKTGYVSEAKDKARAIAVYVQMIFKLIRKGDPEIMKLTDAQINEMIKTYFKRLIAEYDKPSPSANDLIANGIMPYENTQEYLSDLEDSKREYISDLASSNYKGVSDEADKLLNEHGVSEINKKSELYNKLCTGLLRANLENIIREEKKCKGEFSDEMQTLFGKNLFHDANVQEHSPSLAQIMDEFWNNKEGGWTPSTKEKNDRFKRVILDYFGKDCEIHTLDYEAMRVFRDTIKRDGNNGNGLAIKTVNNHTEFYTAVFNHAVTTGRIKVNPAKGLMLSDKRNPQDLTDTFSTEDLTKLFHSKEYIQDKHRRPYNFWIPLLALYTGCRLGELCQLYIEDVKEIDGVWVLDINEDKPDKSVKTHEKRLVPLHPFLINDLCFPKYVRNLKSPNGRIFHRLKKIGHKYGHTPTDWFRKYKTRCGIEAEKGKKTFHSFRHTVADYLIKKDVPEHVVAMLIGHKNKNITSGRYAKRF